MVESMSVKDAARVGHRTLCAIFNSQPQELRHFAYEQFSKLQERQAARLETSSTTGSRYACKVATRLGKEKGYVNASYVDPPFAIPRHYIATQGPIASTVADFWRMVVEQDSRIIVCLTPSVEKGIEKCAMYWPEKGTTTSLALNTDYTAGQGGGVERGGGGASSTCSTHTSSTGQGCGIGVGASRSEKLQATHTTDAGVSVRHLDEYDDQDAACIVRHLEVSLHCGSTTVQRTVRQLHFLGWSDHGVPSETRQVIALIKLANELNVPAAGPMVVHCSAGCGRTGTFCVIDSCAELLRGVDVMDTELERETETVMDPVYDLADCFRDQRTTMVQTPDQYLFCYKALRDIIHKQGE